MKNTEIFGTNIVAPPAAGEDALLIEYLRSGAMPKRRPRLPATEDEFLFFEQWVNNQCPDDPVLIRRKIRQKPQKFSRGPTMATTHIGLDYPYMHFRNESWLKAAAL